MVDRVALSWEEVENLTDRLARQIREARREYHVLLGIARGGMFPCLLLAQVLEHGMTLTCHLRRYQTGQTESEAMPKIVAFPSKDQLVDRRVLVIDEVWDYGDSIIRVRQEVIDLGASLVDTAVLHFKPSRNRYPVAKPTYCVEETERWIDYPWEVFSEQHNQSIQTG